MAVVDVSQKLPSLVRDSEADVVRFIRLVAVCTFEDHWPKGTVAQVRGYLHQQYGCVPPLGFLAVRYGEGLVRNEVSALLNERAAEEEEASERLGVGSACHLCQSERSDKSPHYEFGLASSIKEETHWMPWLAMLASNIITIPLGFGVSGRPGSTTEARIARCRLVFCDGCAAERRGFFGGIRITNADCRRHPSWNRLHSSGYTRWLDQQELAKFKPIS